MHRSTITRILSATVLLCACSFAQQLDFSGAVKNGQTFRKNIGRGLVFVLAPDVDGYHIDIEPLLVGNLNNNDFTTCVTPPFHGPNPTSISARDFQDEHGKPFSPKVVAGLNNREFSFVLTAADQKKACDELSEAMYGPEKKDKNGDAVLGFLHYKEPSLGNGVFHVRTLELGGADHPELFKSLTFAVHIEFPKAARKNKP